MSEQQHISSLKKEEFRGNREDHDKIRGTDHQEKKWTVHSNNQIIACDNKVVLSKSQLHENLLFAYKRVAHRGRQKIDHWVKQNFAEVSQRVIKLFVSLCRLHAEHKPIISRIKKVTNPLQAPSFLSMLEIDLMGFRNLPCTCRNPHKWVINLIDQNTKFVNSHGGEFCNAKLKLCCEENQINKGTQRGNKAKSI